MKKIRSGILLNLLENLPADLYYHCLQHTLDVELQAERIALHENIQSEEDLFLLKIACLYHDSGFLSTYQDHEIAGCELARKELAAFGIGDARIEIICGMIMATRIPQTPTTRMEEVICDADLDYLGRTDFFPISHNLFLELKARDLVKTEYDWNQIQVRFFKQHNYFTDTSKRLRQQQKMKRLQEIEALVM